MKAHTFRFYSLLCLLCTGLAGCSDSFIDLYPISQPSAETFFKTASDIDQAVAGAYDPLQSLSQYGQNFEFMMETVSDNTYNDNTTQSGGTNAAFDNFVVIASNPVLNNTWISCYDGIQRCNVVLNRIGNIQMDATTKTTRTGEVKFLRALTYFNLVRLWGDVPLVTKETVNPFDAFNDVRTPANDVYTQIIKDLTEAIVSLPATYPATEAGRVTKGAAQTLLGKVYLTRKQYTEAVTTLETVINAGTYQLLPRFRDVFPASNKNSKESIFEVQYKKSTNSEGTTYDGTLIGDGNNRPSANMLSLFTATNDPRLDPSVDTLGRLPYSTKRFDTRGDDGTFAHNVIVLRYADVLLMAAEALNEQGYNSGKAFVYLNQVRARAGVPTFAPTDLPNQAAFRAAIDRERRLELAFENHRWFDLLRTGQALSVMNGATGTSAIKFTMKDHQVLFPIPLSQVDASGGKIKQNTGY